MSKCLVIIVNKTKARFLALMDPQPLEQSGPGLVEQQEISNPVQRQASRELWANTKSGGNRGSARQVHGYDDHRQSHLDEFDRRFAQVIIAEILNFSQSHPTRRLILVAEPQILGHLRPILTTTLPKSIVTQELAKDLCKLSASEIYSYLLNKHLLPWQVKQIG